MDQIDQINETNQINQTDLLQLIWDPFGVAGQFHVALSVNRFSLCRAGCFDGAFPIGHLCAAFGGEFLIGHAGHEFQ